MKTSNHIINKIIIIFIILVFSFSIISRTENNRNEKIKNSNTSNLNVVINDNSYNLIPVRTVMSKKGNISSATSYESFVDLYDLLNSEEENIIFSKDKVYINYDNLYTYDVYFYSKSEKKKIYKDLKKRKNINCSSYVGIILIIKYNTNEYYEFGLLKKCV